MLYFSHVKKQYVQSTLHKPFFTRENITNQNKGTNSRANEERARIVLQSGGLCLFLYTPELATHFVELDESIDEFIKTQCNKCNKDISLLKKLLSTQNVNIHHNDWV
jgi:hypothetical protein